MFAARILSIIAGGAFVALALQLFTGSFAVTLLQRTSQSTMLICGLTLLVGGIIDNEFLMDVGALTQALILAVLFYAMIYDRCRRLTPADF